jgi:hypothetical protein
VGSPETKFCLTKKLLASIEGLVLVLVQATTQEMLDVEEPLKKVLLEKVT